MARIYRFNFKSLDVYQAGVEHFAWTVRVAELHSAPFAIKSRTLSAALSIPANVAEANGRERRPGEAEQHYRYAQGSTYESAAYLDALAAMDVVDDEEYNTRETKLARIASMLAQLMRKHARRRKPEVRNSKFEVRNSKFEAP